MIKSKKEFQKVDRRAFSHDHLIGIEDLTPNEINIILDLADYYADRLDEREFKPDILRGAVVVMLFFEDSTRTRISFEMATKRLGGEVVNMDVRNSSVNKGETLLDTVLTIDSMLRPDAMVIRHTEFGTPEFVAGYVDCPVINAGDSWHEHPTQALLDALTIKRHLGHFEELTIAMVGDIAHARTAASNMHLFTKLGANIHVIAPPELMPDTLPSPDIKKFDSIEEGFKGADIVISDRIYKERMETTPIKSDADYFSAYGVTQEKLKFAKPDVLVMAPGPIIRGVQIADDVADDPKRSLILEQVRNGVPTRMAILDLLLKGKF